MTNVLDTDLTSEEIEKNLNFLARRISNVFTSSEGNINIRFADEGIIDLANIQGAVKTLFPTEDYLFDPSKSLFIFSYRDIYTDDIGKKLITKWRENETSVTIPNIMKALTKNLGKPNGDIQNLNLLKYLANSYSASGEQQKFDSQDNKHIRSLSKDEIKMIGKMLTQNYHFHPNPNSATAAYLKEVVGHLENNNKKPAHYYPRACGFGISQQRENQR